MQLMNSLFKRPSVLRHREQGKRVFILANGPSLKDEDLSRLQGEIVIGMNASTMLEEPFGFVSKYYALSDARFISAPEKRPWATTKLSEGTVRVVRSDLRAYDDASFESRTFYTQAISRDGFSRNLSHGFHYGCTTTMLALQLAYHLGSREIYLLGCDLRYPEESPRFYSEENPQLEDAFTSVQLANIVRAAIEIERDGGRVVNCSDRSFLRPYLPFRKLADVATSWK